jgi:hypothetical protein
MRTSSFAMSDVCRRVQASVRTAEFLAPRVAAAAQGVFCDSEREIRAAVEPGPVNKKRWRNGSSEGTPENLDSLDEKDFRNTDR